MGALGPVGQSMLNQYMAQMQNMLAPQQWVSWGTQTIPTLPETSERTIAVVGNYVVKRAEEYAGLAGIVNSTGAKISLHYKDGWVCSWATMPSREAIAAAIRWHRSTRPRTNARDPMGNLLGVRFYGLTEDYHLYSPTQGTVWESSVLTAQRWDEQEAVRGTCGIHAAWPARSGRVQPPIDYAHKPGLVVALVRGYGKHVSGKEGWRAEKVIVDTVYLPTALWNRWRVVKRLRRLYPEVSFEEESWTLEKSSRLAK